MRIVLLLGFAVFAACQHADSAERSAEIVATTKAAPVASAPAVAAPANLATMMGGSKLEKPGSCGGGASCGGSCGGGSGACGGSCGGGGVSGCSGGVTELPTWAALPADATWTELRVTGMHCGGCARRIESVLSHVDGVLGVKIDVASAKVAVATIKGVDARGMVKPAIDKAGYQVQ